MNKLILGSYAGIEMVSEKVYRRIKKSAHKYATSKINGVSIFSAIIAIGREVDFINGGLWRFNNRDNAAIKKAAKYYAIQKSTIQEKKKCKMDFMEGAKWVEDHIKRY